MIRVFSLWPVIGGCILLMGGCSCTISLQQIPISPIADKQLEIELSSHFLHIGKIAEIIEDPKVTAAEKITTFAEKGTIKDLLVLLWYLNFMGRKLNEEVLTLNTAQEIFAVKAGRRPIASFECMEGAMLAASILRQKQIHAYVLLLHDLSFDGGHAICIYRTNKGWGTIGINPGDYIAPIASLAEFKYELNQRFKKYIGKHYFDKKIILFSLRRPQDIHPAFIDGEAKGLLWSNIANFFGSAWF